MKQRWNRRRILKHLAASSAALVLPRGVTAASTLLHESASDREIHITSISEHTVRLSVLPVAGGETVAIPYDGSLLKTSWGEPIARLRKTSPAQEFISGRLRVHVSTSPIAFAISTTGGVEIQNSVVRECTTTGMPVMRALWLHYPEDPIAVARQDQYLWGRQILVAPIVEKAATARAVYLPRGNWYDFWTNDRVEGGREIRRSVDLETMPLYVAAGTLLPLGPVKQYTSESVDQPLSISVYPGADGSFLLYEDDSRSFDYRKGGWMGTKLNWSDESRTVTLTLVPESRMLPPLRRNVSVNVLGTEKNLIFDGNRVEVRF